MLLGCRQLFTQQHFGRAPSTTEPQIGLVYLNTATGGEEPGAVVCTYTLETSIPSPMIRCDVYILDRQFQKALRLATCQHIMLLSAVVLAVVY
jgi:hypothetical protein